MAKSAPEPVLTIELALTGMVALLAADRDERVSAGVAGRRPEVVLFDAGLAIPVIARLLGKKYDTVHNIVSSSKKATGAAPPKKLVTPSTAVKRQRQDA